MVVGMLGLDVVSLLDVPSLVANTSMGGTIAALGPKGTTSHSLHFVVCIVLRGDLSLLGIDPYSTKFSGNTTYSVAIVGFIATNVLMRCDIWVLWQQKMWVASVETVVATVGVNAMVKMVVAFMGGYCHN
jgi:hypothetical protein